MDQNNGDEYTSRQNLTTPTLLNKAMPSKEEQLNDKHRIGFLNQCKLELSAEVIRWKAESLRLQKENEAAVKQIEELQLFANKLARKNHELETSLFLSWEENKRLRMRTLAIGEENSALHERLSKTKYYSYPLIDLKSNLVPKLESSAETNAAYANETWEDVSKKLFCQMQKEMLEMQKLSQTLANHNKGLHPVTGSLPKRPICVPVTKIQTHENYSVEEDIDVLSSDAKILKRRLKLQNEKLRFLLDNSIQDSGRKHSKITDVKPLLPASKSNFPSSSHQETVIVKEDSKNVVQSSDETFRAYFTQQLTKTSEDKPSSDRNMTVEQERLKQESCQPTKQDSTRLFSVSTKKNPVSNPSGGSVERKLCPICEVAFSRSVSDKDFEAHVIAHLEAVSETLLDQLV